MRDRGPGLGEAVQLAVGGVHGVGEDPPPAQQALAAHARAGQAAPVVRVEIRLDAVLLAHGRDLAVAGPVVLVQVRVEVHPVAAHLGIEIAETRKRLGRDREAEARDRPPPGRVRVRGSDAAPAASRPCQRAISSRASPIAASSLVSSAAALAGPTVWMPRPLTTRRPASSVRVKRASCASGNAEPKTRAAVVPADDPASHELGRDEVGERRVGEARFRRKDAALQPLEQLAAAERVGRERLREVHVGVDEPRHQVAAGAHDLVAGEAMRAGRSTPRRRRCARPDRRRARHRIPRRAIPRLPRATGCRRCGAGDPDRSSRRLLWAVRVALARAAARCRVFEPGVAAA